MIDTFAIRESELPVRASMTDGMAREWTRLRQPGTWWTGAERIAIAAAARAASSGAPVHESSLPDAVTAMVGRIATAAHTIDRASIDALDQHGVGLEAYTEMVGIVARLTAIDTTVRGVGGTPVPFPEAEAGQPSRVLVAGAKRRSAHVPMVGAAGAITALSAVAAEDRAQADLHGALYLTYQEMGDFGITKDITRWQMELAATTTSWLNHCVY